jgi:hypothetical protein
MFLAICRAHSSSSLWKFNIPGYPMLQIWGLTGAASPPGAATSRFAISLFSPPPFRVPVVNPHPDGFCALACGTVSQAVRLALAV